MDLVESPPAATRRPDMGGDKRGVAYGVLRDTVSIIYFASDQRCLVPVPLLFAARVIPASDV